MDLATFVPLFRDDVFVTAPNGQRSGVNPRFALADDSARELASLLTEQSPYLKSLGIKVAVSEGWPGPQDKSFAVQTQSGKVAWLDFLDSPDLGVGTRLNAGMLAQYFRRGYVDPATAMRMAERDYMNAAWDQGFGPPPPPIAGQ